MSARGWRRRVTDMLEAIERIGRFSAGLTFEQLAADEKTLQAIDYNILLIGEAARHIPAEVEALAPEIPRDDVRGMRNVIVHQYFEVSVPILWETIHTDLAPLEAALRRLLAGP